MKPETVKRLRNYGLWTAIGSFVLLMFQAFEVPIVPAKFNEVFNGLLGILVLLGVINNPTTLNPGFKDDKCDHNHEKSDSSPGT